MSAAKIDRSQRNPRDTTQGQRGTTYGAGDGDAEQTCCPSNMTCQITLRTVTGLSEN
jgi:hypothetical protein